MSEKVYWVALATTSGIGPRTFAALVERFGSPRAVLTARERDLAQVPRVTADLAAQLRATNIEQIENELYALSDEGIDVLTLEDEGYPDLLRLIPDAPPVLFVRGSLQEQDARSVAVVGTRAPGERGQRLASELAGGLAKRGWTIVSGLARGIDTAAHHGALENTGRTLAVLGSGIRVIHPRENASLAERIVNGRGAVLSEFHPNAPPKGPALMSRDRVISGLARGVIVVEAAADSGSLDTARRAQKQGRLVFAVRGGGAGAESLIHAGAKVIDGDRLDLDSLVTALDAWQAGGADKPGGQRSLW